MLIAPIFHNSYLSPKQSEAQGKNSDAVTSSSSSTKIDTTPSTSSKYNNIIKSAFNRGISFFSKIKIASSSGSDTPTSTTASTSSKPAESEAYQDETSSSSDTSSHCSSSYSLNTELKGFFKPIAREPRTPSTNNKPPNPFRVPSIRSAASSTDLISSPCPSPFFIPITPKRQSAFSLVGAFEFPDNHGLIKPKPTKRKASKETPEKSPKRQKREKASPKKAAKPKVQEKTERVGKRKTRSMEQVKPDSPPEPIAKKKANAVAGRKPNDIKKVEKKAVVAKKSKDKTKKVVETFEMPMRVLRKRLVKK